MSNSNNYLPISVILVLWNNSAHLIQCLDCLSAQTIKSFEIVVIDNGSTDDSREKLKNYRPGWKLQVEYLESNLGFAVANNIGARLAR